MCRALGTMNKSSVTLHLSSFCDVHISDRYLCSVLVGHDEIVDLESAPLGIMSRLQISVANGASSSSLIGLSSGSLLEICLIGCTS